MQVKPMKDRILVKPIRNSEISDGGIFIPRATTTFVTGKERTEQITVGEIVAVGPGKRNKQGRVIPVDANPGDIVTFSDTCGQAVELEGEKFLFIREGDIAGFLSEPTNVELVYA